MSYQKKGQHSTQLLSLCVFLLFFVAKGHGQKIRYVSDKECERYSLDAVYHEKFKLITQNIFKDCTEFASRVADKVADSLTSIMAELPDRQSSSDEEKRVHTQFKNLQHAFSNRVKKMHKNITSSWEALIVSSFDLLCDNGKSSLQDYLNKTLNMTGAYSEARKRLDKALETFISFVKTTVRDGLRGIAIAAEEDIATDEKEQAGQLNEEEKNKTGETREEKIEKRKLEIAEMIVQGFLRKVTIEVLKRKIDLDKEPSIKPQDRDSVLDDMIFDVKMIQNRIQAIIQPDLPKEKGSIDLARRSIYMYWSEVAEKMYKEKNKAKKSQSPGADAYYKQLWKDEKQLMETLLDLMEIYP